MTLLGISINMLVQEVVHNTSWGCCVISEQPPDLLVLPLNKRRLLAAPLP
jgi:hypothetical protein